MPPRTIDEVLVELDQIILQSRNEQSRLGFFTALYRNVTIKVKEGIASGFFEDAARMEQLDVTFANRYLSALQSFRAGQPASKCWVTAFQIAGTSAPTVLQQLLVGINAHINFDLGIAAQAVAPGNALPALKTDFNRINDILGDMINRVRTDVGEVSPWIRMLNMFPSQSDDRLINFSLNKSRNSAWLVANLINSTPADKLGRELEILDDGVSKLGTLIVNPREWLISLALRIIRMRESNDVPHIIDVLSQT
jgi:hypothetical protein